MVVATHDNAIYTLRELDGTVLRLPIVGKRIKAFQRRDDKFHLNHIASFETQEEEEVKDIELETSEDENLHEDAEE